MPETTKRILEGYLDEDEAVEEFGKTKQTLRRWRRRGVGPPYVNTPFGAALPDCGGPRLPPPQHRSTSSQDSLKFARRTVARRRGGHRGRQQAAWREKPGRPKTSNAAPPARRLDGIDVRYSTGSRRARVGLSNSTERRAG